MRGAYPGRPQQIAAILAWSVSPENSLMTGQVLFIDGRVEGRTDLVRNFRGKSHEQIRQSFLEKGLVPGETLLVLIRTRPRSEVACVGGLTQRGSTFRRGLRDLPASRHRHALAGKHVALFYRGMMFAAAAGGCAPSLRVA
jgi:hypothetical protein